jgi:glyoxylase-like metal-dependent hydrolase (beta-lactamase superfamily II)
VKLGQPWVREIVPGVFRVGTSYVGRYAVEDRGTCSFIDTGVPGYWQQMARFLVSRNAPRSAVKAVVLTHHHDDRRGNTERLLAQAGAAVLERFWKLTHANGYHSGQSDADEACFRMQVITATSRFLLKRFLS